MQIGRAFQCMIVRPSLLSGDLLACQRVDEFRFPAVRH